MKRLSLGSLASPRAFKESLVAALLAVFVSYGLVPLFNARRGLDLKVAQMDNRLSQVRQYMRYAKDNKIPTAVALKETSSGQAPEILKHAQTIAAETGVSIVSVRASADQLELSAQGPEKSCLAFIRRLKESGTLYRIEHLSLKPDPRQEGGLLVQLQLAKAAVSFDGPLAFDLLSAPGQVSPARNLFKALSRPQHKNVAAVQGQENNPIADLSLIGIIEDGAQKAVIEDKKTGKAYFLSKEDLVAGMKVVDIKDKEVVLEIDEVTYNLMM